MFTQYDSPAEADHCLVEEAALNTESVAMRQIRNQSFRKQIHCLALNAYCFRADLLIVAHDDDLFCEIQESKCIWPALACLINNNNVERFRFRINRFGQPVERHDPSRDCAST